jgi:hypothetical protein
MRRLLSDMLDDIALRKGYNAVALDLAMALHDINGYDRALLRRFKSGVHSAVDHLKLQDLALKIRGLK